MSEYRIAFDSPGYLALLAMLPLLWWLGYGSLSGLGRVRRLAAIGLRSLVFTLMVLALAQMQWVRISERLTVIYLVDKSLSIGLTQSETMLEYVNEAIRTQRSQIESDRAGVIVFGADPAIEIPPLEENLQVKSVESLIDPEHTNLAGAMKLAQASFPHDAARRIVILSDGNENMGNAAEQARGLSDAGIGIDVVPIRSAARGEVAIEKVSLPPDVRKGQPFELRVVLNNTSPRTRNGGNVAGRLQLLRKTGDHEQILDERKEVFPPGKKVFTFREEITEPDFYTYEARFTPDNPADDTMPQNNIATTFTHVRGSGQVLLIEDFENPGEFAVMVERLRKMDLEVTVRGSRPEELFGDLSQLQPFDTVLLANVPREHFTDAQIQILVRNTQNMGSGLVMLGGPNSFGAGGWSNTPLEEAMPVDFQIKSAKVVPVGALALLMHASELAEGNFWQKKIAQESIKALGNQDYCGLIHWGDQTGRDEWLWGQRSGGMVQVGGNRKQMLSQLDRMTPGDMPQFDPAMVMAAKAFARLKGNAAVMHMIIISDGDPAPPSNSVIANLKSMGVKVSTVAVGTHGPAGSTPLQAIATQTGGKYYVVNDPKTLPRIYQKEARRVARPLVFELKSGMRPYVKFPHEMIQGIEGPLPPITGFVRTTLKPRLAEDSIVSPVPADPGDNPILASWNYGLGKTVALTTDAGKRWSTGWTAWAGYDKLFSQMVRWSMRPVGDSGKFSVATDVQDGKVRVTVTALDKDDEFVNFLNIGGAIVGPDMKPVDVDVKQTAPGRYVGEFDAKGKGNYFIMLNPGPNRAPIRTGVNIPYSDEFRSRETNEGLLRSLASLPPKGGVAGVFIDDPRSTDDPQRFVAKLLETNTFRHDLPKATSSQDIWHLLVLAGSCLFLGDVYVRRVSINFDWAPPLWARLIAVLAKGEAAPIAEQRMDRLRSRKAEVTDQLEQKRAAVRFEPQGDLPANPAALVEDAGPAPAPPKPAKPADILPDQAQEDSYTSRLLKAKQRARDERKREE